MEHKREFPEVKIIAIFGGGRIGPEEYLPPAGAIGAQRTFSKPFETRDLLEAIRNLVGGRTNRTEF